MKKLLTVLSLSVASLGLSSLAQAADLVCLFANANFQGGKMCYRPGQQPPDLSSFPLSDGSYVNGNFGSIQVVGSASATIYGDTNYQGGSLQVTSSIPDLSTAWTGTILSIYVQ